MATIGASEGIDQEISRRRAKMPANVVAALDRGDAVPAAGARGTDERMREQASVERVGAALIP